MESLIALKASHAPSVLSLTPFNRLDAGVLVATRQKSRDRSLTATTLSYSLLIMPFFPLQSITLMEQFDQGWSVVYDVLASIRCFIAGVALVLFVLSRTDKSRSVFVWGVIAYAALVAIACCANGSVAPSFLITYCISLSGFAALCALLWSRSKEQFLNAGVLLFGILSVLGTLSVFMYPGGFNYVEDKSQAIYFLGSKNSAFFYYATFLLFISLSGMRRRGRISFWVPVFCIPFIASTLTSSSANGTACLLIIMFGLVLIIKRSPIARLLHPGFLLPIVVALALLIPVFSSGQFEEVFQFFGRTSHFSMRTYIWADAIAVINDNPLFGGGVNTIYYGEQVVAHNMYLDIASKFGVIALIELLLLVVAVAFDVSKKGRRASVQLCGLFMFAVLVHSLFDYTHLPALITVLFVCKQLGENVNQAEHSALGPTSPTTHNLTCKTD